MSILFYTAANARYEQFTPIYVYSILKNNPAAYVEVGLENADSYRQNNNAAYTLLKEQFGDSFKLTTVDFDDYPPKAVRFLTEPILANKCDFVYISDIDILYLDRNIKQIHLDNMSREDIPFSNIIRPSEDTEKRYHRLSGLHFAPTEIQYPLPDLSGIQNLPSPSIQGFDEHLLYRIMDSKGYMIPPNLDFRPVHGIHLRRLSHPFGLGKGLRGPKFSFNEIAENNTSNPWSGIENPTYRSSFNELLGEDDFRKLYFHLDIEIRNMLNILENITKDRFCQFENEAYAYIISDYFNRHLLNIKLKNSRFNRTYRILNEWFGK